MKRKESQLSQILWEELRDMWRASRHGLSKDALLSIKARHPETAYAAMISESVLTNICKWAECAYPMQMFPDVTIRTVLVRVLCKYAKQTYELNCLLDDLQISWAEYLSAQSNLRFPPDQKFMLWSIFTEAGIQRYNRWLDGQPVVDGRLIKRVASAVTEAQRGADYLQERLQASRKIVTDCALALDAGPVTCALLEANKLDDVYFIVDQVGKQVLQSGLLPDKKMNSIITQLDSLERERPDVIADLLNC